MSALARIAELHECVDSRWGPACAECSDFENGMTVPWPCPTRRLCDEAAGESGDLHIISKAEREHFAALAVDLGAARADAERLAAHRAAVAHGLRLYERNEANVEFLLSAVRAFCAHDALTEAKGKP